MPKVIQGNDFIIVNDGADTPLHRLRIFIANNVDAGCGGIGMTIAKSKSDEKPVTRNYALIPGETGMIDLKAAVCHVSDNPCEEMIAGPEGEAGSFLRTHGMHDSGLLPICSREDLHALHAAGYILRQTWELHERLSTIAGDATFLESGIEEQQRVLALHGFVDTTPRPREPGGKAPRMRYDERLVAG